MPELKVFPRSVGKTQFPDESVRDTIALNLQSLMLEVHVKDNDQILVTMKDGRIAVLRVTVTKPE